jgi:putative Holliday junction resolvase
VRGVSRILAVDWGERRVGLAVSDARGIIATGLDTLEVRGLEDALARVASVAAETGAEAIVVGLPLLMSGERGEAARTAEAFAAALRRRVTVRVDTYDERLTSTISQRRLREVGVRTGHARGRVDQGAAVALLESYLLRLESERARGEGA